MNERLCCSGVTPALASKSGAALVVAAVLQRHRSDIFHDIFAFFFTLFSITYAQAMATCICVFDDTVHAIPPLLLSNFLGQVALHQRCKNVIALLDPPTLLFIHAPLQDAVNMHEHVNTHEHPAHAL
jgi:hypothetical protein